MSQIVTNADAIGENLRNRLNAIRDEVHAILYESFGNTVGELRQLQSILRDAALKLNTSFRDLADSAKEVALLAQKMVEGPDEATEHRVARLARAIGGQSATAMQGLQFEDIATQLLQRVDERLAFLESFAVDMSLLRPSESHEGMVHVHRSEIEQVEGKLNEHRSTLAAATHRSVHQENCDEGSIDLF